MSTDYRIEVYNIDIYGHQIENAYHSDRLISIIDSNFPQLEWVYEEKFNILRYTSDEDMTEKLSRFLDAYVKEHREIFIYLYWQEYAHWSKEHVKFFSGAFEHKTTGAH